MIKFKSRNLSLCGQFSHIYTDGVAYLIGGSARAEMFEYLYEKKGSVNDRDFTIVGGTYARRDRRPRKNVRVEIDKAWGHADLDSYFQTRDFSFNQVAIDKKGFVYATKEAVAAYRKGLIEAVRNPGLSEGARAIRFSNEFGWRIEESLRLFINEHIEEIKIQDVFKRYEQQGFKMEFEVSP